MQLVSVLVLSACRSTCALSLSSPLPLSLGFFCSCLLSIWADVNDHINISNMKIHFLSPAVIDLFKITVMIDLKWL